MLFHFKALKIEAHKRKQERKREEKEIEEKRYIAYNVTLTLYHNFVIIVVIDNPFFVYEYVFL
jgi:hypothetical protein